MSSVIQLISLLNVDMKFFAKVLAIKLEKLIP